MFLAHEIPTFQYMQIVGMVVGQFLKQCYILLLLVRNELANTIADLFAHKQKFVFYVGSVLLSCALLELQQ